VASVVKPKVNLQSILKHQLVLTLEFIDKEYSFSLLSLNFCEIGIAIHAA
jgi:hypothetical protein